MVEFKDDIKEQARLDMSSELESQREQRSVGAMRGLLAEMGGLSALGAKAATEAAEAATETAGGSKAWNEYAGFISARYVDDRCKELLKVVAVEALEGL